MQPLNTKVVENLFIKIPFLNSYLTIGSIYSPPGIISTQFKCDFSMILANSGPMIVSGDFNAKNHQWNNIKNCKSGSELLELCKHNSFNILPPDKPTLIPSRGLPSTVDLVITKNIDCVSLPKTINDLSSDHLPIIFEINSLFSNDKELIFDYIKADWPKFQQEVKFNLEAFNSFNSQLNTTESIDQAIIQLNVALKTSAMIAIPKKDHIFSVILILIILST
jgi:hypothetical protein